MKVTLKLYGKNTQVEITQNEVQDLVNCALNYKNGFKDRHWGYPMRDILDVLVSRAKDVVRHSSIPIMNQHRETNMIKRKPKFKVTQEYMDRLATETGLTHDGGDDSRLFSETIFTRSKDMTEKQYVAMEKDIEEYEFIGNGFEVYAWNDSSGYNYWTVRQEEDNYIQVTVNVTGTVSSDEVFEAARKAQNHFLKYSRI